MTSITTSNNHLSKTTEASLQATLVDTEVDPSVLRQLELEEEMRGLGVSRYWETVNKHRSRKEEAITRPGILLMRQALGPVIEALEAWLKEASSGKAGRRHAAVVPLQMLPPAVSAYLALKAVLDCVSHLNKIQVATKVATRIGALLEDEIMFRQFSDQHPGYVAALLKSYEQAVVPSQRRRSRLKKAARKVSAVTSSAWDPETKIRVGVALLDLIIQNTGWFTLDVSRSKWDKTIARVRPTPALLQWIEQTHAASELMSPVLLPMLCPPRDWTGVVDGGYLTRSLGFDNGFLVRTRNKAFLDELRTVHMPKVYAGCNALQRTAWAVNPRVHDVVRHLWEIQSTLGGLPSARDDEPPVGPPFGCPPEQLVAWKQACTAVIERASRNASRRVALAKTLWVADRFKDERFYFPHFCDFRGRVYPRPIFLTPQGNDYAKGMLMFADGLAIGEQGACWLAVHGANVFGYDKADLQARIDWVQEHTAAILQCAEDPYANTWWCEADKPFQFLAFCFEWAGFQAEGEDYISHLPVALDGSCNGLQNFSMALRDPVGGAAVNLLPAETPQDVYQVVADKVTDKLRSLATGAGTDATLARQWLDTGLVTRKLCKKPVMTLPYGATEYGSRSYMVDTLKAHADEGVVLPWDEHWDAARFICRHIWQSIDETVVAARTAMTFLQAVAQVAAKDRLPLFWRTPSGFVVLQQYRRAVGKVLNTVVGGERLRLTIALEGEELDTRRQSAGIAPNWVHSMDAAHLMETLRLADQAGIEDFAMVHDSYATHAANTEALGKLLRKAFIDTYDGNVLEDFRSQIAAQLAPELAAVLPPAPPQGSLDPDAVLDSPFFFA